MSILGKFSRTAVALGGLLLFIGILLIVASVLTVYGMVKLPESALFMEFLLVVSVLNCIAGILLAHDSW